MGMTKMEKTSRLIINIDKDLKTNFYVACLKKGTTMTMVLNNFIREFVKKSIGRAK